MLDSDVKRISKIVDRILYKGDPMDKTLYGDKYSAEDLKEMEDREVEKLGYCPNCADEGFKVKMFQGSGCTTCPRCGWSPCKVG